MKTLLLSTGKNLLARAAGNDIRIRIARARISASANVDLLESAVNPIGAVVWTSGPGNIRPSVINNDTIRFSVTLPESVGGFDVGNVMIDASGPNGTYIPFGSATTDFPIPKYTSADNSIGSSIRLNLEYKFKNITDNLDINVVSPEYTSLASYVDETEFPEPVNAIYQQFYVQNYIPLSRPIALSRRSTDEKYFGYPFLQRLQNPRFGWLDGGFAGDLYKPFNGDVLFGAYHVSPSGAYSGSDSGGTYTSSAIDFEESFVSDAY